jgi:hypothetical protein
VVALKNRKYLTSTRKGKRGNAHESGFLKTKQHVACFYKKSKLIFKSFKKLTKIEKKILDVNSDVISERAKFELDIRNIQDCTKNDKL